MVHFRLGMVAWMAILYSGETAAFVPSSGRAGRTASSSRLCNEQPNKNSNGGSWWKASRTAKAQAGSQPDTTTATATQPQQQPQRRRPTREELRRNDLIQDISNDSSDNLRRHPMNRTPWNTDRPASTPNFAASTTPARESWRTQQPQQPRKAASDTPWKRSSSFPQTGTSYPAPSYSRAASEHRQQENQRHPSQVTVRPNDDGRGFTKSYQDPPAPPTSKAPWDAHHQNVDSTAPPPTNSVADVAIPDKSVLMNDDDFVRLLLETDGDDGKEPESTKPASSGVTNPAASATATTTNPMSGYSPGSPSSSMRGSTATTSGSGFASNTPTRQQTRTNNPMSGYSPGSSLGSTESSSGAPSSFGSSTLPFGGAGSARNPMSGYNPGSPSMPSRQTGSSSPVGSPSSSSEFTSRRQGGRGSATTISNYTPGASYSFGSPSPPRGNDRTDEYQRSSLAATATATATNEKNLQAELQAEIRHLKTVMANMAKEHATVMEQLLQVEDKLDRITSTTTHDKIMQQAPGSLNPAGSSSKTNRSVPSSFFFGGNNNKFSG